MKYVNISTYKRNKEHIISNQLKGVNYLFRKNKTRLVLGTACLVVALIPNGLGFIAYPLGFFLLKINKIDLIRYKEKGLRKLKSWYYLR